MGHALQADRLLIRPASGRQAGTGFLARTNRSKDTRRGHPYAESQTKNTGTNLTTAPDGAPAQSQSLRLAVKLTPQQGAGVRGAAPIVARARQGGPVRGRGESRIHGAHGLRLSTPG
jgi:hypothetical protein